MTEPDFTIDEVAGIKAERRLLVNEYMRRINSMGHRAAQGSVASAKLRHHIKRFPTVKLWQV